VINATPWHKLDGYTLSHYEDEFHRSYSPQERLQRQPIFDERLDAIRAHNADPDVSYHRGVNHMTDRFDHELSGIRGLDAPLLYNTARNYDSAPMIKQSELPDSVDWRTKGVLTPVKNQGECGSCWAFASAETLESHWAIKTGQLEELSEQFILDCTPNPQHCGGTGGCNGGTAELAYNRLKQLGGIPSEWTYPYISGLDTRNQTCHGVPLPPQHPHSGSVMSAANLSGHVSLPSNQIDPIMQALATLGPLAISVDAGAWHDYEDGVFTGGNSTNPDLDHLVQLVGYGTTEQGQHYFVVRNSWTPEWGESGYIRLARAAPGSAPECGEDITPLDGNGCDGGPSVVQVCGQNGMLYDAVYPVIA
jgi:cathepsin L